MDGCGFGFATGDRVCVAEGRHFQDFAAGDVGVVSDADHSAQTCQVIFRHRPHDKLCVAWRHLRKCGDEPPSFQSRNATSKEESHGWQDFATLDRANLSNQDGLAKDLGHALGAASMAGYWEAALTHLESGPSSSPGLGDWVREFPDEGEASLSAAVEASASARASSFATALLEAQTASSKVKELEEKFAQHSREHWLGLECLQERMSGTASQREVHELKQSFQKELAAVGKHVHGLSDQYQAITDLVASVRKELGYKASHEQLEDLEHQQCKAMESLLHRWDRCAESRRRALETEAGKALGEVQWQAAKPEKEEVRIAEEHVTRLDMLCREQTAVKQQLARLQTDVKVGNASRSLEGHDTPDWEHRFRLLSVKVDGLCSQLEVVQSTCSAADSRATKEQVLDALRLRADAAAEGLASEVRIREEAVQRLEVQLRGAKRDMDAAMDALRGNLEKQLNAALSTVRSEAARAQQNWQEELQRRQDAENSLRSHQCEMAEMRSKLLRKEQALLEASGLKERPQLTWQSSARGGVEPADGRGAEFASPAASPRRLAPPVRQPGSFGSFGP
ncbi:unnamed protein product [Effrenium voratum]|uniref:Uncharacterized protein n=1 Tax=Effrenium voratum TaxID=2562239 RepID=A0AA36JPI2_9DINO|nr:unnamed protein product [Effrenium voratum]